MLNNYFFTALFVAFFSVGFAQRTELKGKVRAYTNDLEGIYIINLNSNTSTTTQSGGYFKILVQENDTLQFSAVHLEAKKVIVKYADVQSELFFVNMELASYNLKEVIVNNNDINAVSMGILSKPAKKYTPAERRLYTATGGGNTYGLNTKVSFDGILNAMSGRTTMLKKEVAVERKEYTLRKINEWFEEDFYTEQLKIPADYIKGFQYYLAENIHFENAVKSKNKTLATFIMGEIAASYLEVINEKK
jgi:hypothetical protein